MKKLIIIALVIVVFGCMIVACSSNNYMGEEENEIINASDSAADDQSESQKSTEAADKLDGEITAASLYSEGYAFVNVDGDKTKAYCIDAKGNIVFTLNEEISTMGNISSVFTKGLAQINNGLCDIAGIVTYPEDVGASTFYTIALKEGYIIAEVITADYSSTNMQLGIMNTEFEWVVEPTAELHSQLCNEGGSLAFDTAINTEDYCHDGIVYVSDIDKYLDLKTGTVSDIPMTPPSFYWWPYETAYHDYNGNTMLDMSSYENIMLDNNSSFVDGYAAVRFYNNEAGKSYFGLIDETGNFKLEPIEHGKEEISGIDFDGEYIIVTTGSGTEIELTSYDTTGKLLGTLSTADMDYMSYFSELNDGVVVLRGVYNYNHKCYYYNADFTPLF